MKVSPAAMIIYCRGKLFAPALSPLFLRINLFVYKCTKTYDIIKFI